MNKHKDNINKILTRLGIAAKTTLSHPRNVELAHFIGFGPSIRARTRLALAAAFLISVPTIFIGVIKTEGASKQAYILAEYDDYWRQVLETKMLIKDLELALISYINERGLEYGQAILVASEELKLSIRQLAMQKPKDLDVGQQGFLESMVLRLDGLIKRSMGNFSSMATVRLSIISLAKELSVIEKKVIHKAAEQRKLAIGSLSKMGRDQLILFLVLLFAISIFVGFVPGWLVLPLSRLKQILLKIESGRFTGLAISGRDEVASLARALKSFIEKREEVDKKKSSKIFEMRNILRSVINRVNEPIFIVDSLIRINYANDAAAHLLGLPSHQIEGVLLADCLYSPEIKKAVELAFLGDVTDEFMEVKIELSDGRTFSLRSKIGVVRNSVGEISRAVVVLYSLPNEKY